MTQTLDKLNRRFGQAGARTIRVAKQGSTSTVVWNPWREREQGLTDRATGEHPAHAVRRDLQRRARSDHAGAWRYAYAGGDDFSGLTFPPERLVIVRAAFAGRLNIDINTVAVDAYSTGATA